MIHSNRMMAKPGQELVVFIIGMRINKWTAVHKWFPVFKAMPPMIRELYTNKKLGFLSLQGSFNLRTITLIQYWESVDQLTSYAKGPQHLKAWNSFYKQASKTNAVGIYHETYVIPAGNYESVYVNMPLFGLAKALGSETITKHTQTAKKRLNVKKPL